MGIVDKIVSRVAQEVAERVAEKIAEEIPQIIQSVIQATIAEFGGSTAASVRSFPRDLADAAARIIKGR